MEPKTRPRKFSNKELEQVYESFHPPPSLTPHIQLASDLIREFQRLFILLDNKTSTSRVKSEAIRKAGAEIQSWSSSYFKKTPKLLPISIPRKKVKGSRRHEDCAICHEVFGSNQVSSLPCSHSFHSECFEKWSKSSHSCPLCREKIS